MEIKNSESVLSIDEEEESRDTEDEEKNKASSSIVHNFKDLRLQSAPEKVPQSTEFSKWLSVLIERHFIDKRMKEERREKIDKFVHELEQKLRKELRMSNLKLQSFGSIDSGFGTDDCDLDLCMINTGMKLPDLDNVFV